MSRHVLMQFSTIAGNIDLKKMWGNFKYDHCVILFSLVDFTIERLNETF
jgi:hypothetical protein